jgi:aldehyde:ferredoxin oxidoreductase
MHTGYMGTILRINLSTGAITREELADELKRQFIGGRGFGVKMLFDELKPGIDPLSPDNKLIFQCGPLAGTGAQSCSRWIVTTKSPLTGGYFRSCAGGPFGAEVKAAGYDALIVEGKASAPVYIRIDDDRVEIRDASKLSGKLTHETAAAIRSELGDNRIKAAVIGPAGEKLVRFSAIVDERRTASRGGVGAVMGSKHLKAVAVRGTKHPALADREALMAVVKKQMERVKTDPRLQGFRHLGTAAAVGFCHELGIYPVRNFQRGVMPEVNGNLTAAKFDELFQSDAYCKSCPIHCGSIYKVPPGPFSGKPCEGPEYETLYSFGGEIGNSDPALVLEANRLCDDYGVDTMTAGATIGFAMECYEKGILTKNDLDGIELTWGNQAAVMALLKKMVLREGAGDLLAEGSRMAAGKIGKGSEAYAMQVKGLELAGYDPRGLKGLGLNYATAPLGASHCVGQCPQELMGTGPNDRFAFTGKGAMAAMNQDNVATFETGIVCIFPMQFKLIDLTGLAAMLQAATGIAEFGDEAYLKLVGERIWNMERAFNCREGFTRADDRLPERFLSEMHPEGPLAGQVSELEAMLDEYYEVRGWDKATGRPTRATLERLGLAAAADELARWGRLG